MNKLREDIIEVPMTVARDEISKVFNQTCNFTVSNLWNIVENKIGLEYSTYWPDNGQNWFGNIR